MVSNQTKMHLQCEQPKNNSYKSILKSKQLFITDLQSTNGTYLRGMKVTPYVPATLSKGDEVRLGRLALQVMFGSED